MKVSTALVVAPSLNGIVRFALNHNDCNQEKHH